MARVREDVTLLDLFDLGFGGIGYALIELLNTLFGAFPEATTRPSAGEGATG